MFRKNVASQSIFFGGVNATTGAALAGLTITTKVTIDSGGTQAAGAGTTTDLGNGQYRYVPTQAETNGNQIGFLFTAANMVPYGCTVVTTAADPTDAVHFGLTCLPNTAVTTNASILTSGTGTDQLSVASGRTDLGKILGTAVSTPATAGILDVNTKNVNNVSAASVTTVNANQGTTQPLNFTGTAASALVKIDMVDVAGVAVSTTTAQLGVNAVNIGGTAQTGRDLGTSVLLSAGSGTGQLDFTAGVVKANATQLLGTAWLTPGTAGTPDVNAKLHGGTAQTGRDIGASVLLSTGTGTGQLDFTAGVVKSNLVQILATALTETAGQIAGAFKQFFNIASPTGTTNLIPAVTTATNLTNAPTVGDFTAVMKASITTAATAATPTVSPDPNVLLIKGKTDNLPASPAAVGSAMTLTVAYDAAKTAAQAGNAMTLTSGERNNTAAALLDLTDGVETGITLRQAQRVTLAASAGKVDGAATTTMHLRNQADTKDRVTATVDANGNRTAITLDLT